MNQSDESTSPQVLCLHSARQTHKLLQDSHNKEDLQQGATQELVQGLIVCCRMEYQLNHLKAINL